MLQALRLWRLQLSFKQTPEEVFSYDNVKIFQTSYSLFPKETPAQVFFCGFC